MFLASSRALSGKGVANGIKISLVNRRHVHPKKFTHQQLPSALTTNLVEVFQSNVSWLNQNYERFFGIAEIRAIQGKVLEAEGEFVSIADRRKWCLDQLQQLKEAIKSIRDKIHSTERLSDQYLNLMANEHKLLKEEMSFESQLEGLKEREQAALDNLSRLLRQSHELERLRQERSKYWQIISIVLTIIASSVGFIVRSRGNLERDIDSLKVTVGSSEKDISYIRSLVMKLSSNQEKKDEQLIILNSKVDNILSQVSNSRKVNPAGNNQGWAGYVPGLVTLLSWCGYRS